MRYEVRRDFVGYAGNPPDPKWPDGARLAVNFVLNYEEGSEPSIQDGEGHTDIALSEAHGLGQTVEGRDLAGESLFEYGSRVGFWRILRLFQERSLPMTLFGCALAFERNHAASAAIKAAGYDVCSHGWRWIKHYELSEAEEREHISKAIATTEKMIGERPLGWYCRYGPGLNTRRLLVEEGGFLYDSDYYGDELPFWVTVEGKPQLVVPYTLTTNDGKYMSGIGNAEQWFTLVRDGFDMLYREGKTEPKMMSVGLHMRLTGQPARAVGLERLLDYMQKQSGVWITRRVDIARHWIKTNPYPGKGLNE
ncbi:MAG: allantoinase PuuE [Alphaproteobacteria bacterium]|nr:allantoinase PuuE [Alphaproteobacteria bacterium]